MLNSRSISYSVTDWTTGLSQYDRKVRYLPAVSTSVGMIDQVTRVYFKKNGKITVRGAVRTAYDLLPSEVFAVYAVSDPFCQHLADDLHRAFTQNGVKVN